MPSFRNAAQLRPVTLTSRSHTRAISDNKNMAIFHPPMQAIKIEEPEPEIKNELLDFDTLTPSYYNETALALATDYPDLTIHRPGCLPNHDIVTVPPYEHLTPKPQQFTQAEIDSVPEIHYGRQHRNSKTTAHWPKIRMYTKYIVPSIKYSKRHNYRKKFHDGLGHSKHISPIGFYRPGIVHAKSGGKYANIIIYKWKWIPLQSHGSLTC